ncbi:ATP-binding protein, partial [Streptomyces sp. NPDC060210]
PPVLVHLPAGRDELLRRLTERNRRADANALAVTPEALDDFLARYEPPGADENPIAYPGDIEALSVLLERTRRTDRPRA